MLSANTVAASGKETPWFLMFDSALTESHSKSPSMTVGTPRTSMGHDPYRVNSNVVAPPSRLTTWRSAANAGGSAATEAPVRLQRRVSRPSTCRSAWPTKSTVCSSGKRL
jgi:hypothetical protein